MIDPKNTEAIRTIEVPVQVTLPFVFEIGEDEDLKPFVSDIWLGGVECLTDSIMPYIIDRKDFLSSVFYLYEREREREEKELNRALSQTE